MDAFDADIIIYASKGDARGSILNDAVARITDGAAPVGIGSVVLLAEALALGSSTPHEARVKKILSALALVPVDAQVARVAATLRATYRLNALDALHLATAIVVGADRFVTGNTRDFDKGITEIPIVFPT